MMHIAGACVVVHERQQNISQSLGTNTHLRSPMRRRTDGAGGAEAVCARTNKSAAAEGMGVGVQPTLA